MVNLRFNFKMDLADISTIDFAFADSYAELESDPFLEKSFPEEGTYSQRSIILTLSAAEAELLPEQFYALATVNFKNGETIKAHAFKNTAKEEALSAALALEDTEFNINFFIDEVSGGGGNGTEIEVGDGLKKEGDVVSVDLQDSTDNALSFIEGKLRVSYSGMGYNSSLRNGLQQDTGESGLASKTYVNNLMSGAIKRLVVESLPTQDIDTNTIYMILKTVPSTNNIYDEYMYINNAWELIGSTEVDLSNYYTKSEVYSKTEANNLFPVKSSIYSKREVDYTVIEKAFRNLSSARYVMGQSESDAVALNVAGYDTLKITATTMTTGNSYKLDNGTKQTFAKTDLPLTIDVSGASKFYGWNAALFAGEYITYDLNNDDFDYATQTDLADKQDIIDSSHKLDADLLADGSNNKPSVWNAKAKTYNLKYRHDTDYEMYVVDLRENQYPNIQKGDLLFDTAWTLAHCSENKRIYKCSNISNGEISITTVKNAVCYYNPEYESPEPPTIISEEPIFDEGDIVFSVNKYIYVCTSKTTDTERGAYEYTWEKYGIDSNNKLSADYIQDGSNYMVIPKSSAADAGKVLTVNSNGQPEWVTP